jgi:adenosylmethionine-8-amino-7-oxononanoate aminotransferase
MVRVGGNNLLMSPPLILTEADVAKILADLRSGLSTL